MSTATRDDRYTLNTANEITRDGKHVGWLVGLTVTLAPYQLEDGRYGYNVPLNYPNAKIKTANDCTALCDAVDQLLTGETTPA